LLAQFEATGAHVYIPRRDRDYAMEVGLRMLTLRHLVEEREGLFQARREELPLLEYYANSVAHLLPHEAPALAGAPTAPTARL
jgi:glycerol-3-phosphate O-acyltransferase